MNTSPRAHDRTRMFARVLGPLLVIVCITAMLDFSNMRTLLDEFEASSLWAWVVGVFVLIGGLTIVALHPYWRGVAAIVVSVLGWLIVLRGILLLAFPDAFMSMVDSVVGSEAVWYPGLIVVTLVGLYLTYVGWKPERPTAPAAGSTEDLPRAA